MNNTVATPTKRVASPNRWTRAFLVLFCAGLSLLVLFLALNTSLIPKVYAQGPDGLEIYYVAPDGDCGTATPCFASVQAAVSAVDAPDDLIKVAEGAYTQVLTIDGLDQLVYLTKTLTLQGGYTTINWDSADPSSHPTILDAEGDGRVLVITSTVSPVVEGFWITGGDASGLGGGSTGGDAGGGVYIAGGSPTLRDNRICQNSSSSDPTNHFGGGIFTWGGNPLLESNQICENTSYRGGGVYISSGNPILADNDIYANIATAGMAGGSFGGGICIETGSPLIQNNAIHDNSTDNTNADYAGGLLSLDGNLILENNLVYGNSSGYGGGVVLNTGSPRVLNNTIVSNTAAFYGGGVLNYSTLTVISNTIIVNNTANDGGGVYGFEDPIMDYSNVWGNSATSNPNSNVITGSNSISADPDFVDYAGQDFQLASGSSCIDTGDPNTGVSTDIDGRLRPFDVAGLGASGAAAYDMGAYEHYAGTCFVRLNDGPIYSTVQAAVDASSSAGDVVKVAGTCSGAAGRVSLAKTLTLRGGYQLTDWSLPNASTPTILDAQSGGRVIDISGSVSPVIENLHLTGGSVAGPGAGIRIGSGSTPNIQNCAIYGNTATGTNNGGGIYVDGTAALWNNTLYDNQANNGAGIYVNSGSAVIHNNILMGNTGHGLYVAGGTPNADYNNYWNNSAGHYGGSAAAGSHDLLANPQMDNPAGGDFHLDVLSPCIDKGDPTTSLNTDYDNDTRPVGSGYDIGADESTEYLGVSLESDQYLSVDPDQVLNLTHRLSNLGNVDDVYNLTHWNQAGWVITATSSAAVDGETFQDMVFQVHIPADVPSGTLNTLVFTATSQMSPLIQDAVTDTLVVGQLPSAELRPDWSESVDPGEVISFTHTLTNTGNAPDTFDLTVENSRGWAAVAPTVTQQLAVGESTWVTALITVPHTAEGGLVDISRVVASSQYDPLVTAVATDTLFVEATFGTRYVSTSGTDTDNNCTDAEFPCASVRHALEQATTGDSILVAGGTYRDHDVVINERVTLRGGYSADFSVQNPAAHVTTLDAQNQGRVLYVTGSGLTPRIEGFRIVNGSTRGNGAGIYIDGTAAPTLAQNTFQNNQADNNGGAIYTMYGNPELEANAFSGNSANNGGAIYNLGGDLVLETTTLSQNSADTAGGAVYNQNGTLTLGANRILSNTADSGAGLYNETGSATLKNNIFANNDANLNGGGLYAGTGTVTVWNNTLSGNAAATGGGVYASGTSLVISNTIVANSSGGGLYADGGSSSLDYNNFWSNSGGDYQGATAGAHSISADPLFVNPASHDYHLLADSDCVDSGDPSTTLLEDFEMDIRPAFYGFDIGADEMSGCLARTEGTIYGSLQRAVDLTSNGAVIDVSGTCWGVAPVTIDGGFTVSQTVFVPKSVTLRGGWNSLFDNRDSAAFPTTIDPQNLGRAFYIQGAVTVNMEDIIIINGDAAGLGGGVGAADAGGGIFNPQGTLNLTRCELYNHHAAVGAALYSAGVGVQLTDSTVYSNTASLQGGGIFDLAGYLTIDGGDGFYENQAGGDGGAIYHLGDVQTITELDLHDNTAGGDGGGIYHAGIGLTLEDSQVYLNTASGDGGAVYFDSISDLSLTFNDIYHNQAGRGGGIFLHAGLARTLRDAFPDESYLAQFTTGDLGPAADKLVGEISGFTEMLQQDSALRTPSILQELHLRHLASDVQGFVPRGPLSTLLMSDNEFSYNIADDGGAVYCEAGNPTFQNNYILFNQVYNNGGGLYNHNCLAQIEHNTLYGNAAAVNGGGIFNSGSPVIHSNIVVKSTAGGGIYEAGTANLDYNDVWLNVGGEYGGVASAGPNSISADPEFVNEGSYDFHLTEDSPCIDTADPASTLLTDFREEDIRPSHQGWDIGADELGGCYALMGGTIYGSLQRAVDLAPAGAHIDVAGVCLGVNTRNVGGRDIQQNLYVDKNLTILGGWADDFSLWDPYVFWTILNPLQLGRVMFIDGTIAPHIEALWLINGDANGLGGGPGNLDAGGGIYNNGSSAWVGDDVLLNNRGREYGGAVYNHSGDMTLTGYEVYSNTASYGAGFYSDGGAPWLINNVFSLGDAGVSGGGIYIAAGSPHLRNQAVMGNQAGNDGGGLYLGSGSVDLLNLTLVNNTAGDQGGGVYNTASTSLWNTIVTTNTASTAGGGIYNTGSLTLDYNDVWHNVAPSQANYAGITAGPHSISENPEFVSAGDYVIGNQSPCRDTGDPNTDLEHDIYNYIRPSHQGYDIGVWEVGGCYVRIRGSSRFYGSLQLAVDIASPGSLLDMQGICRGVHELEVGGQTIYQNLHLTKTLSIDGSWRIDPLMFPPKYDMRPGWEPVGTRSTLDAEGDGRGIYIGDGISPSLLNLVITNGDATGLHGGPSNRDAGGGVYNVNGNPSFSSCNFENGTADVGGGFYNAAGNGTLSSCGFNENQATDGAGFYNNSGTPRVRSSRFANNVASDQGGGLYNAGSSPRVDANTFYSNTAASGGGLYNATGAATYENNVFDENSASGNGGGLYNRSGGALIRHNTFYTNTAVSNGGGIYNYDGTPTVVNTILMYNGANQGGGIYDNAAGPALTIDYNDIYTNTGGDAVGVTLASHNIYLDPDFVDPDDGDFHLRNYQSPAVDAGNPNTTLDVDFEGTIRPSHQGFDMGADEVGGCLAQLNGVIYGSPQAAVDASTLITDVVRVSGYCYGAHAEVDGVDTVWQNLFIDKGLTVEGGWNEDFDEWNPAAYPTTLDALNMGRVVYATGSISTTLTHMRLVNGNANGQGGGDGGTDAGGGVYSKAGRFAVNHARIYQNSADQGGAAYNYTGDLILQANTVYSNTAASGGAIYLRQGHGQLENNLLYRNQASGSGAGIFVYDGTAVIAHNTVYSNTAGSQGGGIYNQDGQTIISNTLVINNSAASGGGIYENLVGDDAELDYNDVWGNVPTDFGNLVSGTHSIAADPLFVDLTNDDFHLTTESPAIDIGDPASSVLVDFEDDSRPSGGGFDLGADEYLVEPDVILIPDYTRNVNPGTQTQYNHTLTNGGNFTDVFTITLNSSQGWAELLTPIPITLGPGESAPVQVRVTVPATATSTMQDTTVVRAISVLNGASDSATDVTVVNLEPQLEIGPPRFGRALPNQTITYTNIITNLANGPDTIEVTFKSDYSWVTLMTPAEVTIDPDMTTTVEISVTILPWPAGGMADEAFVIATSQSNRNVSAAVADTTYISYTTGTRHVAPRGDDTDNNCTDPSYAPCATLQHAVQQATAGDTIKAAQGTYTDVHTATVASQVVYQTLFLTKSVELRGGYATTDWLVSTPLLRPTTLNPANQGRGVYITGTDTITPILAGFHIQNGTADMGGGISVASGEPTLMGNVLHHNSADQGAGLYDQGDGTVLQNTVLHHNTASGEGGGIYSANGNILVENNTLYANTADSGGGLYLSAGTPTVRNTIVSENTATSGGGIYADVSVPNLSFNDVWNNTGGDYERVTAGPNSFSQDPMLANPPGNDFHLQEGSPCVDSGDPTTTLAVDFENDRRPSHQGIDIGADEVGGCYVQLNGVDYGSVQTAVDASTSDSDVVMISGLCQGVHPIWHDSSWISQTVHLTKTVTLQGGWDQEFTTHDPATHPTWLDAQGLGRVIFVSGAVSPTVENLNLLNGDAAGLGGGPAGENAGGAVYHHSGQATLNANSLHENTAQLGAGFYSAAGNPTLQNNVIRDNTASSQGGGVYLYDGAALVEHNTIVQNQGGGLYHHSGTATLRSNIVASNTGIGVTENPAGGALSPSHNDVWDNSGGNYDNVTPDGDSISQNPLFVDAGNDDFHLSGNSPCKDTADPSTSLHSDLDGEIRPQGPGFDMGADEITQEVLLAFYPDQSAAADPGATLYFSHTLVNQGNFADTFDLSISGWGTLLTATPVTLNSGEAISVEVRVDVPIGAAGGTANTTIVTASSQASPAVHASVEDEVTVNVIPGLLFTPDHNVTVDTDQVIAFTHILTNTGNATDIFDLSHIALRGWPVTYAPTFVTLSPDVSATVRVSLTIPAGSDGLTEIVTVTAVSRLNPAVNASVVDTAWVQETCPNPLASVQISGDTLGVAGPHTFDTILSPVNATPPVSYLWDNDDTTASSTRNLALGIYTLTVTATNCGGMVTDTHTIDIILNDPPLAPHSPTPLDGATGISLAPILTWQSSDPDGDPITYTVAFGTDNPPTMVTATLNVTSWVPMPLLQAHTTYYWVVTATDRFHAVPGPVWSFSTRNLTPDTPSNPNPSDGETGVSTTPTLSWTGEDPDNDPLDYIVAFGTSNPPPITTTVSVTSWDPGQLQAHTTYYWAITATDGISSTAGPVWTFSTRNLAPNQPSNPDPYDGEVGISTTPTLIWSGGDPDNDPVDYIVAFGTSNPPPVTTTVSSPSWMPGSLQENLTYYWAITATDGISSTAGPVWQFTTLITGQNLAPLMPSNPNPANAAVGVPLTATLAWQCSDPNGDVLTYTLGFGECGLTPITTPDLTNPTFDPGELAPQTHYCWQVGASDGLSQTIGPSWHFTTTGTAVNHPPLEPFNPVPANGAIDVPLDQLLWWDSGDPDNDPVTYTVAFGTSNPPPVTATVTITPWNPGPLQPGLTYFWVITATDGLSTTVGPVWSFDTVPPPLTYDLSVSKDDGQVTAVPGETLIYNITYQNQNAAGESVTGVVLTETLDPAAHLTYVGSGWVEVTPGVFRYELGDLPANAPGTVLFQVQVAADFPTGSIVGITNTVEIGSDMSGAIESDPTNNIAQDIDTIDAPDLALSAITLHPSTPVVNWPLVVEVTVVNQGTVPIEGEDYFWVELYTKPDGFVPAGPPADLGDHAGGYCDQGTYPYCTLRPEYIYFINDLGVGESETVRFTVTLPELTTYDFFVQADITFHGAEGQGYYTWGRILEGNETNNLVQLLGVNLIEPYSIYLPVVLRSN